MTPEEKANELIKKFDTEAHFPAACALICVDILSKHNIRLRDMGLITKQECEVLNEQNEEVKSELEKL